MGWGLFKKKTKKEKSKNEGVIDSKKTPGVKGDHTVAIRYSELAQIKAKAEAYDKLIAGKNGTFLRRNGIIK